MFLLRISIIISLILSMQSALGNTTIIPLVKKSITGPECGPGQRANKVSTFCDPEEYFPGPHVDCGKIYFEKESKACGSGVISGCIWGEPGYGDQPVPGTCQFKYPRCRHADHGLEGYKTCPHKDFGVKKYKSCRHEKHEMEYPTCSAYMTASEIDSFIKDAYIEVESNTDTVILQQERYLQKVDNVELLSCGIKSVRNLGSRYDGAAGELEKMYFEITGEFFELDDWHDFDCSSISKEQMLDGKVCSDFKSKDELFELIRTSESLSERRFYNACYAKISYENALNWFVEISRKIDLLVSDVKTRKDKWSGSKDALDKLDVLNNHVTARNSSLSLLRTSVEQ